MGFISGAPGTASSVFIDTSGDAQIKTGAGVLCNVTVGVEGTTGSTVTLYDGVSTSDRMIIGMDASEVRPWPFGIQFDKGLFAVVAGDPSPALTIVYF